MSDHRRGPGVAGLVGVVVVRDGVLPAGAAEAVEEAGGATVLIGTKVADAVSALHGSATSVLACEAGPFDVAVYAAALQPFLAGMGWAIVMPASPDGRDLAPRLAALLGWPLLAGAVSVASVGRVRVSVVRTAGRVVEEIDVRGPFVSTLIPGVRGTTGAFVAPPAVEDAVLGPAPRAGAGEARSIELMPPDPATIDLSEAKRIVAGGQGLGSEDLFELLGRVGLALGASLGGTRVASDAGWIPFERQIGTTGVAVNPRLYLAFAISGATQHTSGLGNPDHVISVNLDGSCPMMAMADLAIVSDARAVLRELARLLSA